MLNCSSITMRNTDGLMIHVSTVPSSRIKYQHPRFCPLLLPTETDLARFRVSRLHRQQPRAVCEGRQLHQSLLHVNTQHQPALLAPQRLRHTLHRYGDGSLSARLIGDGSTVHYTCICYVHACMHVCKLYFHGRSTNSVKIISL